MTIYNKYIKDHTFNFTSVEITTTLFYYQSKIQISTKTTSLFPHMTTSHFHQFSGKFIPAARFTLQLPTGTNCGVTSPSIKSDPKNKLNPLG